MFIVALTDQTHQLRIYTYQYETQAEAEKSYNLEPYNALLIEVNDGIETIIKSK